MVYLVSGLWMLKKGLFTWHAPFSMLLSITLASVIFYDYGSSASGGSPIFHLLSGGTMLGAFFIITQPESSPRSAVGKNNVWWFDRNSNLHHPLTGDLSRRYRFFSSTDEFCYAID